MTITLNSERTTTPRTARAFVPGHITGIFRIYDDDPDPLRRGSKGAGFSVRAGTVTTVELTEARDMEVSVEYNGIAVVAPVTRTVVQSLMEERGVMGRVHVSHESSLPIGVGFGASGAGALGTALALGELLGITGPNHKLAGHAHNAEVINHTGLGDVIAQTAGGFEIRVRPGAPGNGSLIGLEGREHVVLAGATGLETSRVLTDPKWRDMINRVGDRLLDRLIAEPSFEQFINCSREFAEATGLMTPRINSALENLSDLSHVHASMVMLGDSVFCFCEEDESQSVVNVLGKYWDDGEILTTSVSETGGRLL